MAIKYVTTRVSVDLGYIGTGGIKLNGVMDLDNNTIINMIPTSGGQGSSNGVAVPKSMVNAVTYTAGSGIEFSGTTISVKKDTVGGSNISTCINVNSNGVAVLIDGTTVIDSGGYLALGTITSSYIESNAVTTAKIQDSAITAAKIANSTITAAKLNSSFVGSGLAISGGSLVVSTSAFVKKYTFSSSGGNWTSSGGYDIWTLPTSTHGWNNNVYIIDILKTSGSTYISNLNNVYDAYLDTSNSNIIFRVITGLSFAGKIIIGYSDNQTAL
jgi:hypothetical protein